jgi:DNA-binding response OmpR family regulator
MDAPTILLIEDDPAMLRGLKDNFQAQAYRVRVARDGREGLTAALAHPPDLVVLDIMLPKLNGYELCRALRARGLEMPIIMLTAKGQEEDIVRGLELGADDYITKPFSVRELLARAKAFLRRRQGDASRIFRFGDCRLDCAAHKLFRSDKEVALTTKEFRLLEFFASRTGRALTREQILDGVWGSDILVNDRSVDRCVTTLRAKVEANPRQPRFIQTIRDIGYRFESEPKPIAVQDSGDSEVDS